MLEFARTETAGVYSAVDINNPKRLSQLITLIIDNSFSDYLRSIPYPSEPFFSGGFELLNARDVLERLFRRYIGRESG